MINACIKLSSGQFPYRTTLCLLPLIQYWQQKIHDKNPIMAAIAREADKLIQTAPELLEPITDKSVVEQHKDSIELLMSAVFPQVANETILSAAITPFGSYSVYHTPAFAASMLDAHNQIQYPPTLDIKSLMGSKVFYACSLILKKFYGVEAKLDKTSSFQVTDPKTGLDRYYKMSVNPTFVEIKNTGSLRPISADEMQMLLNNFQEMDLWLQYLPPENFEFSGFIVFNLTDITDQEVMSSLKYSLLEKESIVSDAKFAMIQRKIRTLINRPDIRLGIGAFQRRRNTVVNYGQKICHSFIFRDVQGMSCTMEMDEFYQNFMDQARPLIIEDIASAPIAEGVREQFIAQGIRNMVFIPLFYDEVMIGVLELGSPHPSDLNTLSLLRIEETLPLFSLAVKRSFEEQEARIEAVVKEKFTAIHPSVEWRFTEAAMNLLEKQDKGETVEIEPIVFNEVYPLYGASDIRNSSVERNKAIQQDLITQLSLAKRLLDEAIKYQPLPILEKLNLATGKHIERIKNGLLSDAEITIHDFLKREIEPVIEHLTQAQPILQADIERYWHALDPALGVVYQKRKEFEDSLTQINETLSAYIEEEEVKTQQMFPHYFEKYKTDGIEYNMYIGASLVEDMAFHSIYLKNLRLWQLITMCEIARRTKSLKSQLKVPLETTQLILVHNQPLSIRFRMDERHFDVDGAYNIRYEIIKKRIDKAVIKGTNERLTQPGKIVIIYSQVNESVEYNDYIEYLQEKNLLTNKIERVELEDLQGVQGLKAIRVEVNLAEAEPKKKPASKQILEMVQAYTAGSI